MGFQIERLEGRGMKAKVINGGNQYDTYRKFAEAAGYPEAAKDFLGDDRGDDVNAYEIERLGHTVNLLAKGKHGAGNDIIYVAAHEAGKFLIGENGLEIIEAPTLGSATDGQLIAELKKRAYERGYSAGFDDGYAAVYGAKDVEVTKALLPTRAEIVKQAKEDVETLITRGADGKAYNDTDEGNDTYQHKFYQVEFVTNHEKRAVTALIRHAFAGRATDSTVQHVGVAKCDPSDCFNEYIGKAIALRRALGLDVPSDYLNATEPEGKKAGDIIDVPDIRVMELVPDGQIVPGEKVHFESPYAEMGTVIDDTARYQ